MAFQFAGQFGPQPALTANGLALPDTPFYVYSPSGQTATLATLYTNQTMATTAANPARTDSFGNITFFAAPARYDVVCAGVTLTVVVQPDPADINNLFNAEVLIASQVLGTSTSSGVTFSSIPQTYNHLRVLGTLRSTVAGTFDSIGVLFNADAGNHAQSSTILLASSSLSVLTQSASQTFQGGASVPGVGVTAGVFGAFSMDIPNYTSTTVSKTALCRCGVGFNLLMQDVSTGTWNSTAAINTIRIGLAGGGNLVAGSAFYLYGIT